MKIFYAVQATGNGHISRAMELLPALQEHGTVDIFLSGDNSNLALNAPIKYRSKGISLYYNCRGGLDYWQMIRGLQPLRVREEIRDLPVEKYDLILNDFDYITSMACARKKVPSIHFGHQASFQSAYAPRPDKKNKTGEWLLRNYVKAQQHIGLHFESYDNFILKAVVKRAVLEASPRNHHYITVYLPSFCEPELRTIFHALKGVQFQVFSRQSKSITEDGNIRFIPVDKHLFTHSMIHCSGIITGGGFETPAEALHLGKKIMAIPIRGQYEQQCNAAALQQLGVTCLAGIDESFAEKFYSWINITPPIQKDYSHSVAACMDAIFSIADKQEQMDLHELATAGV